MLDRLLDSVRSGHSLVLVPCGEAGVFKSAPLPTVTTVPFQSRLR